MIRPSALTRPRPRHAFAALALMVPAAVLAFTHASRSADTPAPASASAAPGTFRPTPRQWAGLTIAPVTATTLANAISTEGTIATNDERTTPVFSPFTGRITRVLAQVGQRVGPGTPLFAIAGAELVQVRADLATATAARTANATALRFAQINARRQSTLSAGGAAATREAQQAQVDLATAQSNMAAAQATLTAARGRLAILGVPLGGDDKSGAAIVRAPVQGVITTRALGVGQFVQSAASGASVALLTISNLGQVYLVANLREADVARVHVGDRIEAAVTGLPGRTFHGRVDFVGPAVDPATRRTVARATIENPGGVLRPGMFADTRVLGRGTAQPTPTIPETAVVYEGEGARVWVAHPDRTLEVRAIRVGRTTNGQVQVLAGLRPGERVVTSGAVFIDRAARPE